MRRCNILRNGRVGPGAACRCGFAAAVGVLLTGLVVGPGFPARGGGEAPEARQGPEKGAGIEGQAEAPKMIDVLWEEIRGVTGPELSDSPTREELEEYWSDVGYECHGLMFDFIKSEAVPADEVEKAARELLLKGIGANGADGMRWLAATERYFVPEVRGKPHTPAAGIWYDWEAGAAKAQVELMLNDKQARRALYRIFAWRRVWLKLETFIPIANMAVNGLDKGVGEPGYWRHARDFIFVAIATGREDLLEDIDPKDLDLISQEWVEWAQGNIRNMRASSAGPLWLFCPAAETPQEGEGDDEISFDDLPELFVFPERPFSNWTGPPPLPAKEHPIFTL